MKTVVQFIILIFVLTSFRTDKSITIDKEEAKKAFVALQDIRKYPNKYFQQLHFDKDLKISTVLLQWNDTLAKVAEAKAFDMANRNYFGHVDPGGFGINYFINKAGYKLNPKWTQTKDANYFESLTANIATGEEAIKYLVKDSITPFLGHRKHLLGLDNWNSTLTDIGIGFTRRDTGSMYQTYICVIIAKHDW
ncbi:MAG: CAP domain-containing protein [Chitinophagaceae bacterium]|nr:CAP domain-containing protein [Chitinophagaceae bacterium]